MSGHTPGPWLQSYRLNPRGLYSTEVYDEAGDVIATCAWHLVKTEHGIGTDREANARLISAAPDLLEALRRLESYTSMLIDSGDCGSWESKETKEIVLARAAIAKATFPNEPKVSGSPTPSVRSGDE